MRTDMSVTLPQNHQHLRKVSSAQSHEAAWLSSLLRCLCHLVKCPVVHVQSSFLVKTSQLK
ncbi:mCG147347 [Mus musculus]|nr:mCG147347 [Mus musculus]